MKHRIFKNINTGGIIIDTPNEKFQSLENFEDCPIPDFLRGVQHIIIDEKELPKLKDDQLMEQLYFDGDLDPKNLLIDKGWSVQLMPSWLIHQKIGNRHKKAYEDEVNKTNPDLLKLHKLNFNIQKHTDHLQEHMKDFTKECVDCYEQALDIIKKESLNKPTVIKKLNDKIKSLKPPKNSKK